MTDKLHIVVNHCVGQIVKQPKNPLFVAITGDSGSGKSYLANLIKAELESKDISCTLVNHDDFLISRADREPMKKIYYNAGEFTGKSRWEVLENMFRLDEYQRVITELKAGHCSEYYAYSRESGTVNTSLSELCPQDIILFDTSMMLKHMDYIILVDVTQENIIQRKIERDSDIRTPQQIIEMHRRVQGYYWSRGKPSYADIIIDNNEFGNIHVASLSS